MKDVCISLCQCCYKGCIPDQPPVSRSSLNHKPLRSGPQTLCAPMQSRLKSTKEDLMNRLNNALKQRDAARENALVEADKLNKLQVHQVPTACVPDASRTQFSRHVRQHRELRRQWHAIAIQLGPCKRHAATSHQGVLQAAQHLCATCLCWIGKCFFQPSAARPEGCVCWIRIGPDCPLLLLMLHPMWTGRDGGWQAGRAHSF